VGSYQVGSNYYGFKYDGDFTTIAPPGTTNQAEAHDINDSGKIVGFYNDNNGTHGFVFDGVTYKPLNYLNYGTLVMGINNDNKIVGSFGTGIAHGFFYDGSYSQLDVPGAKHTFPNGINNNSVIVGQYYSAERNDLGFVYDGVSFDYLKPGYVPCDINDFGIIVGEGFMATPVPLPSAIILLGAGVSRLVLYSRKKTAAKN
jgi:probable HAF family extracellular repeat protein